MRRLRQISKQLVRVLGQYLDLRAVYMCPRGKHVSFGTLIYSDGLRIHAPLPPNALDPQPCNHTFISFQH